MNRLDAAPDDPEELAVRSLQLPRDHRGPHAADAAVDGLDQKVGRARTAPEHAEIRAVADIDAWHRPAARRIDQVAFGIEQVDAADIGQRSDLGLEHGVNVLARHPPLEALAGIKAGRLHEADKVLLHGAQIVKLLVEVARQQQHGVLKLPLAALQRPFAGFGRHDGRAHGDRQDQRKAAEDEPTDRSAARGGLHVDGIVCM
jgi:hypothetical protein